MFLQQVVPDLIQNLQKPLYSWYSWSGPAGVPYPWPGSESDAGTGTRPGIPGIPGILNVFATGPARPNPEPLEFLVLVSHLEKVVQIFLVSSLPFHSVVLVQT